MTFPLSTINGRWSACICLHEGTLTCPAECGKFGALCVAYIGCTLTQKIGNEGAAVCKRVDNRLHNTKNTSITICGVNSEKRTVIIMMCKKKKYLGRYTGNNNSIELIIMKKYLFAYVCHIQNFSQYMHVCYPSYSYIIHRA